MRYFLFNHSGSKNHGCEAIVRGTVNIIENYDRDCSFLLSSYDPDSDNISDNVEVCRFGARELTGAEKLVSAFNVKFRHSEDYAFKKMYSDVIEQAKTCDVCLSIGGDTYCYGDNPGIRVLTEELKTLGKKVVLWGASVGEEDLSEAKLENLKVFDAVFARESLTYELLKKRSANEKLFLNSDPAFCMEREDVSLPDGYSKNSTLGLNLSPLVAAKNPELMKAAEAFVKYVIDNTTLDILLIPHVVEEGNSDYEYMLPLFKKFGDTERVKIVSPDLNAMQYKGIISKLRFFIGARTHATIAAYSSGVPTFVLGYSVKARGIAYDIFGHENYVADVKNIENGDDIIAALNILLRDEEIIRNTLKRKVPMQLRSAMQMGEKLSRI